MILTKNQIIKDVRENLIQIHPFNEKQLNPNSYNYRLGNMIKVFKEFDGEKSNFEDVIIPNTGIILQPGQMYLGNTFETIGSSIYTMSLIGRSSIGRLGLFLQCAANLGHTGTNHQWTLELTASKCIKLYPFMLIGQVSFWQNRSVPNLYQGYYGQFNEPTESNFKN